RDLQTYFGFEYPQAIYKWQHGECLPTVDNLLALARLLQVSMEDLLVYDDQGVVPFFRLFF
ncbi:MAG: helix-turn-helix transcriptional regulator, partial [Clostridia bacterium]|nr:helix-turn-helix transcriptional regulator [Clostridia bacterium]